MADTFAAHREHFRKQAEWCERLGSPFNAQLLRGLARQIGEGGVLDRLLAGSRHKLIADGADAGPLRIAGALHALTLAGRDTALRSVYPAASPEMDMARVLPIAFDALSRHEAWIADFITRAPQTNETRRAIGLLAGFSRLQGPLHLLEIGASAGLNQHWDAFGYDGGHWQRSGAPGAPVIETDWIGPAPDLPARFEIASRRACDLTPLDIEDNFDRFRVKSYIWPDQTDRLERLDKAITIARVRGVRVEAANAADWLAKALSGPLPAGTTVIYHSIAWQYFDADTHRRAVRAIEAAGTRADDEHRLAWLRYESAAVFDANARKVDHRLDMISWPGQSHAQIASVDPHGFRVELSGEG